MERFFKVKKKKETRRLRCDVYWVSRVRFIWWLNIKCEIIQAKFPCYFVDFNILMESYCFCRLHWGGSRLRKWSWAFATQSPSLAWRWWWRLRTGRTAWCLGRYQPSLPPADPPLLMLSLVRSLHFSFFLCLLVCRRRSKVLQHILFSDRWCRWGPV